MDGLSLILWVNYYMSNILLLLCSELLQILYPCCIIYMWQAFLKSLTKKLADLNLMVFEQKKL